MTIANYLQGRFEYNRPQAMLWADNPGTLVTIPSGPNAGQTLYVPDGTEFTNFILLSDHNRAPIDFKTQRINKRDRMINGNMRAYHIADKLTISTSWQMLPSRAFNVSPAFDASGKTSAVEYIVDNGAGGNDLLRWYQDNTGSFWVYLAYDKYIEFEQNKFDSNAYGHLNQYNQIVEMYITDFSYTVEKRGGSNHDLWNISVTLEEV